MKRYSLKAKTLLEKIEERILRKRRQAVFMRSDFKDLGGYDQVGLALRQLTKRAVLLRLGYGLYVRAHPSIFNGEPVPRVSIRPLMKEVLRRLGIKRRLSIYERFYVLRRSNQVVTGRAVGVDRRVRRKLGYNGMSFSFEFVSDTEVRRFFDEVKGNPLSE